MPTDYTRLKRASAANMRGDGKQYLKEPYLPQEVSDVDLAFPAHITRLTPDPNDIPDEFWAGNQWTGFADTWFAFGLAGESQFWLKEGIDGNTAFRHLRAIMGSFEPKHEHKIAVVGYLASLWFDAIEDPQSGKTWGAVPTEIEE